MAARACALLLLGALSSGNELEDYLWVTADAGQTCTSACQDAGGPCDVTGLAMVTTADLVMRAAVLAGTVCDSPTGATKGWAYAENPAICASPGCCGDGSCQGVCTFAVPGGSSQDCDAVGRVRFCSCAVTSTRTSTTTSTATSVTATSSTKTSSTETSSTRTATTVTVSSTTSRTSSSSSTSTASSTTSATSSSSSSSTVSTTTSRTSTSSSSSTVSSTTSRSSTSSSSSTVSSTTSASSSSTSSSTVSSTTSRTSTSTSSSRTTSTTTKTSTSSSTSTVSSTTSSSTSRTSTSSSTTSRTSTTTSSTATRTAVVKAGLSPGALVDWVATEQSSLLAGLFSDPARAAARSESPDARTVAVLLDRAGSAENKVPVAGTAAVVAVPASAIEGVREEVAAVVSVFKEEALKKLKGATAEGATAEMVAAVNVDLATAGGAMEINGLREPVRVGMPGVNSSLKGEVKCAYWHEAKAHWSFEGLTEAWENEELVCETVHLSLFAAILQGFLNALKCSQLTLLNGEAVRELFRFKWVGTPVALFFWLLVVTVLCLFVMTCRLDGQRGKTWGDEYFLIPTASADMDKGEKKGEKTLEAEIKEEIKKSEKFANHALRNLVMMSLRKQASAALWYSDQVVDFVCKDKDFEEDMWRVAKDPGPLSARDAAWRDLHQSVDDCMRDEWKRLGGWVSVSEVASLIFLQVIPVVSVFTWCPFKSSSLRLMLLTCKLFGSLMIGALFFQASGEFLAKSRPQECVQSNLGEKIGRIVAISVTSTLLAALPCLVLAQVSGRTRKLTKVDAEDVKQAERKLARWRMVDKAVWCISSLYLAFCTFFILLFIANTNPSDQPAWGVSGLTTLVKDEFLVPLMLSVLLPFLTVAALLKAGKMTTASGLLAKTIKKFENAGNHGHVYV